MSAVIAVDDEKGRLFDELRRLWDESEEADETLDTAEAWRKVDSRLRHGSKITSLAASRPPSARRRSMRRRRVSHVVGASVVLLAVVIATVVAVHLTFEPQQLAQEPDFRVFATTKGERATVRLSDGSRVLLNADSRLAVPSQFREGERTVQFEGQGYFKIAKKAGRSFVVRTELADVEVLGTEFDVHAYPESEQLQVVVATGEVSVRSNQRADAERIVLKPRDLGLVLLTGGQLVRRNIDVDRYIAWREGQLVFDNASFDEVAAQLERWYDLHVVLSRPSNEVDGLTVTFENESVDEVLNVIAAALNLNYSRRGKDVTFYPAP